MVLFLVVCTVFIVMTVFPFVSSFMYYKNSEALPLYIDQSRVKNPRYFARTFAELIEEGLKTAGNSTIDIKGHEKYIDGDSVREYDDVVEDLIICREGNFHLSENVKALKKELYINGDGIIENKLELKAAYATGKLDIKNQIKVERWIDAEEELNIWRPFNLGISASSKKHLNIYSKGLFRRLYAEKIVIETVSAAQSPEEETLDVQGDSIEGNLISKKSISVDNNVTVNGSIKSHGEIVLKDNVRVTGNIFAEKSIYIGKNTVIEGNIFTQENIYIDNNCQIGTENNIKSMVARGDISIKGNAVIYGLVSGEGIGRIFTYNSN